MSILPKTKFGDCANPECGAKNTEVVKVGKETFCVFCRQAQKAKVQVQKANVRNQVRGLYGRQVESGNEDAASRSALIQDIDFIFSRIVRLRAADSFGNCHCFTCNLLKHWTLQQAGHYISRSHMGLRWDFRNVRVQCAKCNELNRGEIRQYKQLLDMEVAELSETLENEAKNVVKIDLWELKQLLIDLRSKLRVLESKFKTQNSQS